jgi:hypothetical protein
MRARKIAVVATVAASLLLTGCGGTINGKAVAEKDKIGSGEDYQKLLGECNTVADEDIAKTVDGTSIDHTFYGAICRWDIGGPSGNVKVTFNWFETGSLDVERKALEKLKYGIKDISVQGRKAIQETRPGDGDSCGVTAGAPDIGIIGWWVQYPPGSAHGDPCAAATKLMELSLDLSR